MEWLRWYHGTVADPKWRAVAVDVGVPVAFVVAVWAAILEHASESDERGTITNLHDRVVGAALDIPAETVRAIRQSMEGLVLEDDRLTGWDRRQPDSSTERVRRHRKRKTQQAHANPADEPPANETPVKRDVTPVKRDVTQRNTGNALEEDRDTDTDTDLTTSSSSSLGAGARENPAPDEPPDTEAQVSRIIVAANQGMRQNPSIGDALRPIPTGHGSRQSVHDWLRDGIPPDFAADFVERRCAEYEPNGRNQQPNSMRYFDAAVRQAWEEHQTREATNGSNRGVRAGTASKTRGTAARIPSSKTPDDVASKWNILRAPGSAA